MSFWNKFKEDLKRNRETNSTEWRQLKVASVALALILIYVGYSRFRDEGPWYLGCADRNGKELMLQTDKKPRVQGSLIFLEDDIFVTPEAGMTCRIVSVKQVEAEKALDNPI